MKHVADFWWNSFPDNFRQQNKSLNLSPKFHEYLNSVQQMVSGELAGEGLQTGFSRHGLALQRAPLDTVYPLREHLNSVQGMVSGGYCEGLFPDTVCWTQLRNTWKFHHILHTEVHNKQRNVSPRAHSYYSGSNLAYKKPFCNFACFKGSKTSCDVTSAGFLFGILGDGQITHLTCVRLEHLLYDSLLGSGFPAFSSLFLSCNDTHLILDIPCAISIGKVHKYQKTSYDSKTLTAPIRCVIRAF